MQPEAALVILGSSAARGSRARRADRRLGTGRWDEAVSGGLPLEGAVFSRGAKRHATRGRGRERGGGDVASARAASTTGDTSVSAAATAAAALWPTEPSSADGPAMASPPGVGPSPDGASLPSEPRSALLSARLCSRSAGAPLSSTAAVCGAAWKRPSSLRHEHAKARL